MQSLALHFWLHYTMLQLLPKESAFDQSATSCTKIMPCSPLNR